MNTDQHTGTDLQQVLQQGLDLLRPAHPRSQWLTAIRERGAAAVATEPLPTRKHEDWRYTSLDFLDRIRFQPPAEASFDALTLDDVEELLLEDSDALRLPFVNGYLALSLLPDPRDLEGITITNLGGKPDEIPVEVRTKLDTVADQRHVFGALNSALMSDGALIHVPDGLRCTRPIDILNISVGMEEPFIAHPRHLIVLGKDARAEVIERYCTTGNGTYFNNALIEIDLGTGSELKHERVQEESPNARHLSDLNVRLAARSRYRLTHASLGGAWARTDLRILFAGEDASAELNGLMLAGGLQLNDVHLDVQHRVPNCTSRENFKSILDGKGRVVFDGHILVAEGAQKTDAELTNDNLMLSRSAEVDTKPQLEIYADDVKCSHGTTVGELDGDMLFYLRSRGIPEPQAKEMLCLGFAEEVLSTMDHAPLRARLSDLLTARLTQTV